jgi:hypothetical protein
MQEVTLMFKNKSTFGNDEILLIVSKLFHNPKFCILEIIRILFSWIWELRMGNKICFGGNSKSCVT